MFTGWPVAVPIPNRESKLIGETIFKEWICVKGVPARILSDRGRELISQAMLGFCKKMGTRKCTRQGTTRLGTRVLKGSTAT